MLSCRAVLFHELRLLLYSPLTYIFLLGFIGALSVCVFLIADFYASDQASIRLLLVFLPWVALILVPALAMRSWSDEYSDRSVELVLTLPLRLSAIVIGKFLAGYSVLLLALLFTAPLVVTVYYLGAPDGGRIFAGYLAMALLLGLYYALAMLAAALTREPVAAFVLGVGLLFLLLLLGWDTAARALSEHLPAAVLNLLNLFSPKTHLDALASGWIRVDSLVYFILFTSTALLANGAVIRSTRRANRRWIRWVQYLLAGVAGLSVLAGILSTSIRVESSFDLTQEREFTLSSGTLDILSKLPGNTEITLYWSASQGNIPVSIKNHAERVQRLLKHLVNVSGGHLQLMLIDPIEDTDPELAALEQGIQRTAMSSGDYFFFGATFTHGERSTRIAYFDIQRDRHLEYDIALNLVKLTQQSIVRIGIISPLLAPTALQQPRPGLTFLEELKRAYDIAVIPYFADTLPEQLNTLILLQPAVLKQSMLYAIDQFVMRGGSLIVILDPYLRFDRASNELILQPSEQINDISDLLLQYGVRYHGDNIIGDRQLASPVGNEQQQQMSYPYWLRIDKQFLSATHPVSASLNEVFFAEAGALSFEPESNAQVLVSTSTESGIWPRAGYADKPPGELTRDFTSDQRQRIIAALLQGPLNSAFNTPPESAGDAPTLKQSQEQPKVFVIADSDWLFDPFALQVVDAGGQTLTRPLNDNLALLFNMIEYASGEPALATIRTRGRLNRPFTRVGQMFKTAEKQYREQETDLAQRVATVESHLQQVLITAGAESLEQLPEPLRTQALQLRRDMTPLRKELRDIRHQIRADIERLGQQLLIINLLAGPFLVIMFAGVVFALRWR